MDYVILWFVLPLLPSMVVIYDCVGFFKSYVDDEEIDYDESVLIKMCDKSPLDFDGYPIDYCMGWLLSTSTLILIAILLKHGGIVIFYPAALILSLIIAAKSMRFYRRMKKKVDKLSDFVGMNKKSKENEND